MELIDRREILNGYEFDRLAERFNPTLDRSDQVAVGIMLGFPIPLTNNRCTMA
jgi:hypothetical protein